MTRSYRTAALAVTALFAAGLGATVASAAPVTATAQAKAKVLKQISVTKAADLDFGTIVVSTSAGTVAIDAAGSRTCDAALTCSGTVSAAAFAIGGTKNEAVTITSDPSVTLINALDGSQTMTAALVRSANGLTLDNSGKGSFNVGGTLSVAASQLDGLYSGDFNVTVDYQ